MGTQQIPAPSVSAIKHSNSLLAHVALASCPGPHAERGVWLGLGYDFACA